VANAATAAKLVEAERGVAIDLIGLMRPVSIRESDVWTGPADFTAAFPQNRPAPM